MTRGTIRRRIGLEVTAGLVRRNIVKPAWYAVSGAPQGGSK
jgi:hypothetical protein